MNIREVMNKHPGVVAGVVGGLVAIAVLVAVLNSRPSTPGAVKKVFYSDDDGKTYFVDDAEKIPPFDHNGKPAHRANVYQCGNGQSYVAYLMRYSDAAKAKLTELAGKEKDPEAAAVIAQMKASGIEVKKPGETKWIPPTGAAGSKVMEVSCPDGSRPKAIIP